MSRADETPHDSHRNGDRDDITRHTMPVFSFLKNSEVEHAGGADGLVKNPDDRVPDLDVLLATFGGRTAPRS